jgi:hypothetical protein
VNYEPYRTYPNASIYNKLLFVINIPVFNFYVGGEALSLSHVFRTRGFVSLVTDPDPDPDPTSSGANKMIIRFFLTFFAYYFLGTRYIHISLLKN